MNDPQPGDPLTERELEVVKLLCQDLTRGEIANYLFLAPSTVRNHVHRILVKLGVRSRVGIVVWAIKSGLVDVREL